MTFSIIVPIILGLLPSLGWLAFYLKEDLRHPEPNKLIFYTFLAGVFSTIFVLQIQILVNGWLEGYVVAYGLIYFLVLALIEEVFKFLAVYFAVGYRKEFDEPIDAMIYMIVAALGFAAVENVASIFQAAKSLTIGVGPLETVTLRFVGATLLHTISSGLVGYYWGKAMAKKLNYSSLIARGLIFATILHAIFNYFIINFESLAVSVIFLIFVAIFILNDFERLKRYK